MFGGSSSSGGGTGDSLLPTFQDEPACAQCCPNLSFKHRIIGFAACQAVGFILSLMGTLVLFGGTSATNIRTFAVLYVLGNIIALCATGFLSGPKAQCKKMWLPTRRYSTAFYLIMIIVVFIVAVMKQNVFLVLFLLAVEIVAGAWYSISYIPFARKIVLNFLRACGICFPCFYVSDQCHEVYEKNFKSSSPSTMTSVMGGGSKSSSSGGMFGGNSNSGSQSSSGFFGGGNTTTTSSSGGFFGGK